MSPRPCHGSECRSRQPSACSGASARWTASSERAPTRLRRASESQWRAHRPSAAATMSSHPATRPALTLAAHRPRSAAPTAPHARLAGARQPPVLLAPRIVHPVCPDDHSPPAPCACAICGVQQPLRLLAGRQKHRLADRLAGRRALPPVALPSAARQPFPVPRTPRTLRAPLLAHDLDRSPRMRAR